MHRKEWSGRERGCGDDFRAFVCIDVDPGCLPVMSSEENSIAGEAGKEGRALMTKAKQSKANNNNNNEEQPDEVC